VSPDRQLYGHVILCSIVGQIYYVSHFTVTDVITGGKAPIWCVSATNEKREEFQMFGFMKVRISDI
jgi:hypothetical protein